MTHTHNKSVNPLTYTFYRPLSNCLPGSHIERGRVFAKEPLINQRVRKLVRPNDNPSLLLCAKNHPPLCQQPSTTHHPLGPVEGPRIKRLNLFSTISQGERDTNVTTDSKAIDIYDVILARCLLRGSIVWREIRCDSFEENSVRREVLKN